MSRKGKFPADTSWSHFLLSLAKKLARKRSQPGAIPREAKGGSAAKSDWRSSLFKCLLAGSCSSKLADLREKLRALRLQVPGARGDSRPVRVCGAKEGTAPVLMLEPASEPQECRVWNVERAGCACLTQRPRQRCLNQRERTFWEQWDTKLPCRWVYTESMASGGIETDAFFSLQAQIVLDRREGLGSDSVLGTPLGSSVLCGAVIGLSWGIEVFNIFPGSAGRMWMSV